MIYVSYYGLPPIPLKTAIRMWRLVPYEMAAAAIIGWWLA
jgi:hypothetical protein